MKKLAGFLVKHRLWCFVVTIVIAASCAVCMNFVSINEDLSQYLPSSSNMRQGLDIMEDQFPEVELTGTFKLMFEDLTDEEKEDIILMISNTEGVESVAYDASSVQYEKDGYSLFVVTTIYKDTDETNALMKSMLKTFEKSYDVTGYYQGAGDSVLSVIVPIALVIVLVILLIMCSGFFEPVLMIVTIGVAIVINMGTNIIFASVASMTYSIAAVIQLILSMDYSIILMHRYAQEKASIVGRASKEMAMENALQKAFGSVASSALTTIVGLLMLLFMSFTIGMDMGLVFAKGVLFSLICVFTIMPSLILWSDKLLTITDKGYIMRKIKERRGKSKKTQKEVSA